ncbi:VOC family protein [Cryobacterium lactosi]|uniref:VOC family protein n=1 Tax=Cryobacterium lactosi TaxID=1259202 RepID=A0A4R9BHI8_9MICO|nr:VOC family protein [Cryobacterium lactosi]TFD84031.1 VOC family protein [Cryobacterium lactosi]
MPRFTGIHHLALTVSNLDTSAAFYQLVFGFPPTDELDGEKLHRRLFALPGGVNIGLTEHTPTTTERFTPFRPGMDHLGFAVENIEELQRWAEYLTGAAIDHCGLIEADYGTALSFKDPDGVALEFFVSM